MNIMKAIGKFVSSLNLRLSDLFLAIGIAPFIVFLINGQYFMREPDSGSISLKTQMIIPLFLIAIISWFLYVFLEAKRGNKVNRLISCSFILLLAIGILGIFLQPQNFEILMIKHDGEEALISQNISTTHYLFFASELILVLLFLYISLFIFPKRFTNIKIIQFAGYAVFVLCFILIICKFKEIK